MMNQVAMSYGLDLSLVILTSAFLLLHVTHSSIFILYVLLGPTALALALYLVDVGRRRMSKLLRASGELPAAPPLVSILIPAKDEGAEIRTCVRRVCEQDYPDFEIIAVNDRSADDTGVILDELACDDDVTREIDSASSPLAGSRRKPVRVVHVQTLPDGWLGKCHALEAGTRIARGQWFLFVDSDVRLQPDALRRALALAIERGYDALSILTTIRCERFVERLLLPPLAGMWSMLFAIDQTNEDSEPDKAAANGQFFLIRREAYEAVGGHAAVKDRIVEDVELMRTLKAAGKKCRLFAGRHLAETRMHTSLHQIFHGWGRILAGTARGSVWPMTRAIFALVVTWVSVYPALVYALVSRDPWWLGASVTHLVLVTLILSLVYRWSGNARRYALLWFVTAPALLAVLIFSIRRARSGRVVWRGMSVRVK